MYPQSGKFGYWLLIGNLGLALGNPQYFGSFDVPYPTSNQQVGMTPYSSHTRPVPTSLSSVCPLGSPSSTSLLGFHVSFGSRNPKPKALRSNTTVGAPWKLIRGESRAEDTTLGLDGMWGLRCRS